MYYRMSLGPQANHFEDKQNESLEHVGCSSQQMLRVLLLLLGCQVPLCDDELCAGSFCYGDDGEKSREYMGEDAGALALSVTLI